jgi:hypothetical protein
MTAAASVVFSLGIFRLHGYRFAKCRLEHK